MHSKEFEIVISHKAQQAVQDTINAIQQLNTPQSLTFIEHAALLIADSYKQGGKIITAGNGGSLCDAAHFAEEMTGFFRDKRPALPAISLSEPGHITCVANDIGYEWVFSRGIEAFGQPGDVFIGLTTSGNSPSIIRAFEIARKKDLKTIAFLGKGGGKLKGIADIELIIDGYKTSDRIQEVHMAAIHIIIELIESKLFT
jgi:D-sedoheptulose 7-phosphate isomerase